MEVVYIRAIRFGRAKVRCTVWFQDKDPRNVAKMLPGRVQTANCGLLFALREALACVRKVMVHTPDECRIPLLIVKTDATYVSDGVGVNMFKWVRNDWCNSKHKHVANIVFWKSVHHQIGALASLGVDVRVEHCQLPTLCTRF